VGAAGLRQPAAPTQCQAVVQSYQVGHAMNRLAPGPRRNRGRRHPREAAAPELVNGRCELTGPGRKLPGRATRAGCSGSVPRTPCPCGLSAVHAPVGRQTYLQPSWDERAPSRPTYQRPDSLPQSPRGFASSSSRSFRQRHCHSPLTASGAFRHTQLASQDRASCRLFDTAGEPRAFFQGVAALRAGEVCAAFTFPCGSLGGLAGRAFVQPARA
jgi:hypothetical protein